jgi:hypothetical protein
MFLAILLVASLLLTGVGAQVEPAQADDLPAILHSTLTCYSPLPGIAPTPIPQPPTTSSGQHVAVPSYFYPNYPDPLWSKMEAGTPTVGMAVINPDSGPNHWFNQDYADQVASSRSAGLIILGYVSTNYAGRTVQDVECEIDQYYSWYGVDGIFFDEASKNPKDVPYYREIYDYVKAKEGKRQVVINPGTQTDAAYMTVADIIVNFEGTYASYISDYHQPDWVSHAPAESFWHLVYKAPTAADMQNAVAISKDRNAGWVYITDDVPNQWDTLPSYWSDLLQQVETQP